MIFNDDEQIVEIPNVSGEKPVTYPEGKTNATVFKKKTAPLEKSEFKVMLELAGAVSSKDRDGLDLVTILDISGSMGENAKLEKLKIAMQFIIKKLGPIDRLSVVTFNEGSTRLCPLRWVNENFQADIENQVNALVAKGATNITAGLQTGLKVIKERSLTSGRAVGIMLMSDGEENVKGADASKVQIGNLPVYTFGFGLAHDSKVLMAIANNGTGGTYSNVQNLDELNQVFSQCLAGRLTVVVQDLKLTVTQVKSTIQKVSAGSYEQINDVAGSVTVLLGDLYQSELRKVMVYLLLPAVSRRTSTDILKFTYTYRSGGLLVDVKPVIVKIIRNGKSVEPEREEVRIEDMRIQTAQLIKDARDKADQKQLVDARKKLNEAQDLLEDESDESNNPLIEMLKFEVQQLLMLMTSQPLYEKQGRPFALSGETSHGCQRYAARGDVENLRFYTTPRMDEYLKQAKLFDDDPKNPKNTPPTVDEDVKQEIAADPLGPIIGALSYHIRTAIQSLKSIEDILNSSR